MAFLLYLVGFVVFISGMAWAATALGVAPLYVDIGAAALLALGVVAAIARSRADAR